MNTVLDAPAAITTAAKGNLLLVDDDADILKLLSIRLKASGYQVMTATSGEQALSMAAAERPDLVVTDLRMAGLDGMALFHEIERRHTGLPVIILTAHGTIPDAVAATRQGVFGYLTKPYDSNELLAQVNRALTLHGSAAPARREDQSWHSEIITKSPLMEDLLLRTERVAQGEASVLIQGESGTGKELLARALHNASRRAGKPFVAINCGAIPEALLESELFGHKKGAFTGATSDHPGLFVEANTGSLLLDEIGDMPIALQVKLLRALEAREIRPVGSTKTIPIDVRVISASHKDLNQAKADGTFREDLFYRLNVVTLRLPALRERREDIPLLLAHFLQRLSERYDKAVTAFAPEALEMLIAAPWPGNIRQLYNVAEQVVALSSGQIVSAKIVEQAMQLEMQRIDSFEDARRRFEYDYLTRLLKLTQGSVTQAAKLAKRNRTEFYKLLQRHSIEAAHFKPTTP
ncbi:MAG: sigma 54-interacting transcriptional regulator [Betaproteobacteria bacterium]|nr:sigma 54-interacting transcriptional regulator [Betaproteobacteria bacterium]